jgi:hypothetical protein
LERVERDAGWVSFGGDARTETCESCFALGDVYVAGALFCARCALALGFAGLFERDDAEVSRMPAGD